MVVLHTVNGVNNVTRAFFSAFKKTAFNKSFTDGFFVCSDTEFSFSAVFVNSLENERIFTFVITENRDSVGENEFFSLVCFLRNGSFGGFCFTVCFIFTASGKNRNKSECGKNKSKNLFHFKSTFLCFGKTVLFAVTVKSFGELFFA